MMQNSIPRLLPAACILLGLLMLPASADADDWSVSRLLAFTDASCRGWEATGAPAAGYAREEVVANELRFGDIVVGSRFRLSLDDDALVELDVVERDGRAVRFVASWFSGFGDPLALIALASDCSQQAARLLEYSPQGQARYIVSLDTDLQPVGEPDWLNPPLEFYQRLAPRQPGEATPVRVGMLDSGVNYQLAEINQRLARDADGRLIGYDFWEMDDLPYDSHPVNSGFFVQRHGTRSASLLLREAPQIELVPYRYPRPDMSRMDALVRHASDHQVAILGMPLGSNRAEDWTSFASAASEHPHILFIASAGNDGRDIDVEPVFPAVLDLDNLLVVSSADDFVQPAEGVNWGRKSVDYLLPAERRLALDYTGNEARVSGSSYAVSRLVALAARIKTAHRDWTAAQLIAELQRRYGASSPDVYDWVARGYIADPLADDATIVRSSLPGFAPRLTDNAFAFQLPLEVLRLDTRWSAPQIANSLEQAYRILAQCDIGPGQVSAYAIEAADYLLDLSTGSARSLLETVDARRPVVVFARDTRMQEAYLGEAFGAGNTRRRPWLSNSVWLMRDVDDAGIALAHELYHVLANSGAHVDGEPNLMQAYTRPDSTALTAQQCRQAQIVGQANGLLIPRE
jgi:hypothetical protein